jgi:predicted lipid carrier protein YhbT
MNGEEAIKFRERWRRVNAVLIEEARRTPVEVKLQQLAIMFEAARALGWTEKLREGEEEEIRERWRRLKEKYGV